MSVILSLKTPLMGFGSLGAGGMGAPVAHEAHGGGWGGLG